MDSNPCQKELQEVCDALAEAIGTLSAYATPRKLGNRDNPSLQARALSEALAQKRATDKKIEVKLTAYADCRHRHKLPVSMP